MKKTIAMLLFVAVSLTSCWKTDKPTEPRLLANAVFKDTVVPVKFELGYREIKGHFDVSGKWIPSMYALDSMQPTEWATVPIRELEVVMNGQQVMKYCEQDSYPAKRLVGWFIIAAVIFGGWKIQGYYEPGKAKLIVRGAALALIVAIAFLTQMPADIAQNNAKTVTEFKLKHYQNIDHELNYFWDSVYKTGGIIGAKKKVQK